MRNGSMMVRNPSPTPAPPHLAALIALRWTHPDHGRPDAAGPKDPDHRAERPPRQLPRPTHEHAYPRPGPASEQGRGHVPEHPRTTQHRATGDRRGDT